MIRQVSESATSARRSNRRGQATRDAMLDAALRALATGDVAAASANRIAKDAGATWGAVKYQFGDIDGLWAAVLRRTAERRGQLPSHANPDAPLRERVAAIIDLLFDGLSAPDSRAIETLRAALPRDGAELERLYPKTAAELQSWGRSWIEACQQAFSRRRRRSRTGPRGRLVHPGRDAGPRLRAPTRFLLRPRYGKAWPDQRHCDVRASCANAVRRTVIMAFRCATRHGSRKPPNPSRPTKAGLPHHV